MPKVFTSQTQKIGEIGENIASRFLMKQGYSILDRNYTKKWGELDIVAQKERKVHFVEVKSVSRENLESLSDNLLDNYKPEDNMHPWKLKRLSRAVQTYLLSKENLEDMDWQVDLICVFLDMKNKKAKIKIIEDIVL